MRDGVEADERVDGDTGHVAVGEIVAMATGRVVAVEVAIALGEPASAAQDRRGRRRRRRRRTQNGAGAPGGYKTH